MAWCFGGQPCQNADSALDLSCRTRPSSTLSDGSNPNFHTFENIALTSLSNLCGQRYSLTGVTSESSNLLHLLVRLGMMAQTPRFGAYAAVTEISRLTQEPAFLLRTSLPYNQAQILRWSLIGCGDQRFMTHMKSPLKPAAPT